MKEENKVAYPWYSTNKRVIWNAVKQLLALPDSPQCLFAYNTLTEYFLFIEALEGDNAWQFFLKHYGVLEERFPCSSGFSTWEFIFYNLIIALCSDVKRKPAEEEKVWRSWYSLDELRKLERDLCQANDSLLWSWASFGSKTLKKRCYYNYYEKVVTVLDVKYPVRGLRDSILKAIEERDMAKVRLEIDLSRNQDTMLKNVRHALLNKQMFEELFVLRKDYTFPEEEEIPPLEYFLWERWNSGREAVFYKEDNEKEVASWDEDNNLVRLLSFNEKLCNATLEQLQNHDLLTPAILKAVLEHLGNVFNIEIPKRKTIAFAAKLMELVQTLPEEKRQGTMDTMYRYFRKSYFQQADVCRECGVSLDGVNPA